MTAATSGTADDYLDLVDKIREFVSTDSNLLAAGQEWTVLDWGSEVIDTTLYLRGPGLAGQDTIYVGLRAYENAAADWFNIACRPFLGFLEGASWATQPGAGPERGVTAWDQPIPYWIAVDGRRFIVGYRVSTVDQIMHCGLLKPYATPDQFPLPLMVAGTMPAANSWRWSETDANHNFFTHGGSSLLRPLRHVEGTYLIDLDTWPYSLGAPFRETYGDEYPLLPIVFSHSSGPNVFAEVDGLFWIPGFAQASGNTFSQDGDDYIVLQNVFRSGSNSYIAMRLS
jgi:hypothetical protein